MGNYAQLLASIHRLSILAAPTRLASTPFLFYTMKPGACLMDAPEKMDIYACKPQRGSHVQAVGLSAQQKQNQG
jgi:hypothetical protein